MYYFSSYLIANRSLMPDIKIKINICLNILYASDNVARIKKLSATPVNRQ